MTDPVERSDELDRKIAAIPVDQVFSKRRATQAFAVLCSLMLVACGLILNMTHATNQAVSHEIPGLKEQIRDRDKTIAGATSALTQLTDALQASQQQVRDLGGTPKDVVVRTDKPPEKK